MATMKNKQTARKMTIDAEKLNDILDIVHTQNQQQKDEMERMNHKYKEAVKQIATLGVENHKLKESKHSYLQMGLSLKEENEKLKKEVKELKEEYEDDMLSYETLIGDITEHQDYQELIDEHEFEMDKLEEKNKELLEVFKYYWSGGVLGKEHSELRPAEWQQELEEAQK
jgi:FtsZ-binding cell division protein ZapB